MKEIFEIIEQVLKENKHIKVEIHFCGCEKPSACVITEIYEEGKPALCAQINDVDFLDLESTIKEAITKMEEFHAEYARTNKIH